jgi:magnesium-transporting ATPase (P-type)
MSDEGSDFEEEKKEEKSKNKIGNYQIALIRRFDFSSKLQRMSVIVRNLLD